MTTETQNPTPGNEGASTLDRIQAYLSGSEPVSQPVKQEPQAQDPAEPEVHSSQEQSDEVDDGAQETEQQPQLTTTDLAKLLDIDEDLLDLAEDGKLKLRAKIDGKVVDAPKLADLLKTHQIHGHAENRAREVAAKEAALTARAQEAEQQFAQRLQYAEGLTNVAAQELLREFQSIDWNSLEQQDAGQAALLRQKFQERQAQLRGVFHNIEQNKAQIQQKFMVQSQEQLQKEAQRLPDLIPEWKDEQVAHKERAEIREWAVKAGIAPQEIDSISRADVVAVLRKAMLHDRLQQSKPEIEKKVRLAPKLVKPGQPSQNSQADKLQSLKQSIKKSGGRHGIAEYLLASGKV